MFANSLGNNLSFTSFGESHGKGVGVVIDGLPAGMPLDLTHIQKRLNERRPGSSAWVSPRDEKDRVEVWSGVFQNQTTGAPITLFIPNQNAHPRDYDHLKEVYRPSHADFTYQKKYGIRDHRGGGRSSARITAGWVAAGAVAEQFLKHTGIEVLAYVKQIYHHALPNVPTDEEIRASYSLPLRCPHPNVAELIKQAITEAQEQKDSLGGIVGVRVLSMPIGLGEPVFKKLNAQLAHAMLSINAVKGIQFGMGFEMSTLKGSQVNDLWTEKEGHIVTQTNFSGGLQGGISNGMPLTFEVAFKPTATLGKPQQTVTIDGKEVVLEAQGRHDPCVVPRAVPIVSALTYWVLADLWIAQQKQQYG